MWNGALHRHLEQYEGGFNGMSNAKRTDAIIDVAGARWLNSQLASDLLKPSEKSSGPDLVCRVGLTELHISVPWCCPNRSVVGHRYDGVSVENTMWRDPIAAGSNGNTLAERNQQSGTAQRELLDDGGS